MESAASTLLHPVPEAGLFCVHPHHIKNPCPEKVNVCVRTEQGDGQSQRQEIGSKQPPTLNTNCEVIIHDQEKITKWGPKPPPCSNSTLSDNAEDDKGKTINDNQEKYTKQH